MKKALWITVLIPVLALLLCLTPFTAQAGNAQAQLTLSSRVPDSSNPNEVDLVLSVTNPFAMDMSDVTAVFTLPEGLYSATGNRWIRYNEYVLFGETNDFTFTISDTEYKSEEPTVPTTPGTDPTEPGTQPTTPTAPGTDPTEPSDEPTEPSEGPTEPSSEPTEPSSTPSEPGTQPTQPGAEPTQPSEPGKPDSDSSTAIIAGIIVGLTLIIVAIVVLVIVSRSGKKGGKALSLLLCIGFALTVLSLASLLTVNANSDTLTAQTTVTVGGKDYDVSVSVTYTLGDILEDYALNSNEAYVKKYSDDDAARQWLNEHILNTDTPPVSFMVDGVPSEELTWTKSVGKHELVTYFEDEAPFDSYIIPITYTCAAKELSITMDVTIYPGYPVVEYEAVLHNLANGNSYPLSDLQAIDTYVEENGSEHVLHANKGSTYSYDEFKPFTYTFYDGYEENPSFSVVSGKCTMEYIPYFNVENPKRNTGTIAIMNWQGTWNATFTKESEGMRMTAGQGTTNFVLQKGEKAYFPGMVLLFYKGNWMNGQNVYRRWIYQCNMFRYQGKHMQETNVLIGSNSIGGDNDIAIIEAYKQLGLTDLIDKFNIDAGWYPKHGETWEHVGDWFLDENMYPDGMKPVADAAEAAGLDFALWFEPERVLYDTQTAKDLKDHIIAIGYDGYGTAPGVNHDPAQHLLVNYADPEAVDYMVEMLAKSFKEYGVDQYRQDFNIGPGPYWAAWDATQTRDMGIPRTGLTENHYCKGYIEVFQRLQELFPGMYYDACASGGMRYDLETMRSSFLHTRSDYWADIESAQVQTYGSSMWFLYWGTGLTDFSDYDVRSHLSNSIGVGITSTSQADDLRAALTDWKYFAAYLSGDYYPLTEYVGSTNETMALQYDHPEEGKGMFVTYFRKNDTKVICPQNLDPAAKYNIWNFDDKEGTLKTMTGAQIMAGIEISSTAKTAIIYEYELAAGQDTTAFQNAVINTGVPSDLYTPEMFENPYALKPVDVPQVENTYVPTGMTDEQLKAAYAITGDNKFQFVSYDQFGSGTIYAVSKNVYDELTIGDTRINGGWRPVDTSAIEISVAGTWYPYTTWNGNVFTQQPYAKEIGGTYFVWFTNTIPLSDTDGSWQNWDLQVRWKVDGGYHTSETFLYIVEPTDVQKITADGIGSLGADDRIFKLDKDMFGSFVFTGYGIKANGQQWYEIDPSKVGFIFSMWKAPDATRSIAAQTAYMSSISTAKLYAAYDGENCWLYIANASVITANAGRGRTALSWIDSDGNYYAHSFLIN